MTLGNLTTSRVWPTVSSYDTWATEWEIAIIKLLTLKQMINVSLQVTHSEGFDH